MGSNKKQLLKDNLTLLAEWDYEKNAANQLFPETTLCGSNKKAWWKCSQGHSWEAAIIDRANGSGCPYCSNKKVLTGYNDLATTHPELIKEWNFQKNVELRINEVTAHTIKKAWWICEKGHEWEAVIASRTQGSGCPICANRKLLKGYNDLATLKPDLIAEWHPTKNNGLEANEVIATSNMKAWWQCKHGHEWECRIVDRVRYNSACPICSGKKILKGYNDLATLKPDLVAEWHPTKNVISPSDIGLNSKHKVWWRCSKGHEWQAAVYNRVRGSGCPLCYRQQSPIKQLFFDVHPELLSEWDSSLNPNINSKTISLKSNKKALWKCSSGHIWEASFANRDKGSGCPYCSGNKIIQGKTDLETTRPDLLAEWHYEKNSPLLPSQISANSGKKVWWKCAYEHEWEASVRDRSKGHGCPICAGKKVLTGYNDLATISPQLAKEWHPTKNGSLLPSQVTKAYGSPVWWMCSEGHEWQTTVGLRLGKNTLCPYCSGKKVITGKTDLQTLNPQVASEWNYERNSPLRPNMVTAQSQKIVWWKCAQGHEWQASISNRNKGRGCPICSNKQVLIGYNDLATTHPEIAAEWNYEKNTDITPTQVTKGAHNMVWWRCSLGHEWQTSVMHRTSGTGCPICSSEQRVSFPEKAVSFYIQNAFCGVEENYHADWLGRFELDIALPEFKIGIEYDGEAWHTNPNRDSRKDLLCLENNYTLIRIREKDCPIIETSSIVYRMENNKKDLPKAIQFVADQICQKSGRTPIILDIDIERDRAKISKLIGAGEYEDVIVN